MIKSSWIYQTSTFAFIFVSRAQSNSIVNFIIKWYWDAKVCTFTLSRFEKILLETNILFYAYTVCNKEIGYFNFLTANWPIMVCFEDKNFLIMSIWNSFSITLNNTFGIHLSTLSLAIPQNSRSSSSLDCSMANPYTPERFFLRNSVAKRPVCFRALSCWNLQLV